MTGAESLNTNAGDSMEPSVNSDGSNKRCIPLFALFANMREYIQDMNYGDASQIIVNSMIPLFDNDVFKLNGKYDYESSGLSIIQVSMMINPVNTEGRRFIHHHQNAVRFMLDLLAGKTMIEINKSNSMFPSTVNIISDDNTPFDPVQRFGNDGAGGKLYDSIMEMMILLNHVIRGMGITILNSQNHEIKLYDLKVIVNDLAIDDNLIIRLPNGSIEHKPLSGNALEPAVRIITPNDYDKRIKLAQDAFGADNEQALAMALFESAAPTQNVHVFIIEDNGGTGKTTLFRGIGSTLKPFIAFISVDNLAGSPFDRGVEFAKTEGKKIVLSDESQKLNEKIAGELRKLTTGAAVVARYGNGRSKQVWCECKVWIASNYDDDIDDSLKANDRRIIRLSINGNKTDAWWKRTWHGVPVYDAIADMRTISALIIHGEQLWNENNGNIRAVLKEQKQHVNLPMKIIDTVNHIHVLIEHNEINDGEPLSMYLASYFTKQDKQLLESFGIVNMNARTKYDASITGYKKDSNDTIQRVMTFASLSKFNNAFNDYNLE